MEDTKYTPHKVNSWFAFSSPNIPTFEDALMLAVKYDFDIKDLVKEQQCSKGGFILLLLFYVMRILYNGYIIPQTNKGILYKIIIKNIQKTT